MKYLPLLLIAVSVIACKTTHAQEMSAWQILKKLDSINGNTKEYNKTPMPDTCGGCFKKKLINGVLVMVDTCHKKKEEPINFYAGDPPGWNRMPQINWGWDRPLYIDLERVAKIKLLEHQVDSLKQIIEILTK